MPPIKFRAWHTLNKEMVVFDINKVCKDNYQQQHLCNLMRGDHGDVLMQFTGLTDKNGVDIYEGDILFADGNNSKYTVKYGYHELTSHYDYSPHECTGFYLNRHNGMDFNQCESIGGDCSMLSVIGNEHQSPELMESK